MKKLFTLVALCSILLGCSDRVPIKKTVTGKAGEIIVVSDKASWEGEVGNALRNVLAIDYPMLPQREPAFNLINIQKNAFNDLFKSHRNLIITNIDKDITSNGITLERDKWAKPQILVYIDAASQKAAAELIDSNKELIFNAIDQIEKDRIIRNSKKYEEKKLREIVREMFGVSLYFPNGFALKKSVNNFIWIACEATYVNQGVLIYTIPCKEGKKPDLEEITQRQNEVLKENVPGMFDGSYMTIANGEKPILKNYKYKGKEFTEVRGFWEVVGDYMGGPFVEHILPTDNPSKLLVVQGFVYAPKYKKRNYLRQVEAILYSLE